MFEMDNQPLTPALSPKGERGLLRGMRRRWERKMELARFAKFFLVEYLNSGKDVDAVVEEWLTLTPDPSPEARGE